MENIRLTSNDGIICDNPNCDYKDPSVQLDDVGLWLNKPCPKCGENLLTQEDYDNFKKVIAMVKMLNALTPEELALLGNTVYDGSEISDKTPVVFNVGTHKEISLELVEDKKP